MKTGKPSGQPPKETVSQRWIHESCPFFFTRTGASLSLPGIYRGGAAFLIAGGPSFESVDKDRLNPVWTMTLNNAVASYRGNAACLVDDPSRFSYSMWLDPKIQKFVPLSALEKPLWDNRAFPNEKGEKQKWCLADRVVGDCANVVAYRRNEHFDASQFLYEETINWGCHEGGGGRSVMLPALRILFLLGFRKVYLLGVDFEMTAEKKYHFPEDRSMVAIRSNMETYSKLQRWLGELQPYFLAEDFIIKNCNPESRLEAFPFLSLEEAIGEATDVLGSPAKERTSGMYRKLDLKLAEATEEGSGTDHSAAIAREELPGCTTFSDEQIENPRTPNSAQFSIAWGYCNAYGGLKGFAQKSSRKNL